MTLPQKKIVTRPFLIRACQENDWVSCDPIPHKIISVRPEQLHKQHDTWLKVLLLGCLFFVDTSTRHGPDNNVPNALTLLVSCIDVSISEST